MKNRPGNDPGEMVKMGNENVIKKGGKLKLVVFYLLFVLVNIVINRTIKSFGSSLYLDSIGTVMAAVLGGYLPGIFVGYVTNIINLTADITNLFYAGISVLIAVTATFMARRGFFDKFWKALITIPFLAFMGGAVGSVLTWFIYGSDKGFFAQLLSDFWLDLIDKAITVVVAYVLIKLIPESIREQLPFTDWRQKPMDKEHIREARHLNTRGLSLRSKIMWMIGAVMAFIAVVTTIISFFLYRNYSMDHYAEIARNVSKSVAISVDGDEVNEYLNGRGDMQEYDRTMEKLQNILDSADYIEFVYVYQVRQDGNHVVFDIDTPKVKAEKLGDVIPHNESFDPQLPAMLRGEQVEPVVSDDEYGWLLIDYEPVYDSDGNCVCYACADISMIEIRRNGTAFLAKILSLFMGFFILVLALCVWFSDYHLTYPVDAMTFAAGEFEHNTDQELDGSVEKLKSLDIETADEIENLYQVLVKTISETVGYLEEVKQKGEQIEYMQSGLIYILADLVESRDKCTGDHVKKTAAYVMMILQILKEKNIYPDQVTDDYIRDVCNSAPLHDIGKIKVPDAILNKPDKLTDEEFAIMKTHTTAGKSIIESAMRLAGEAGYLSEALNLATYHHERWDGKGYPEGLKGEEIPLSARIMAVADVFDALLSRRSYKPPFTFDEAMKIMEEGRGTQFDPVIVDAFLENRDRINEITLQNARNIG